ATRCRADPTPCHQLLLPLANSHNTLPPLPRSPHPISLPPLGAAIKSLETHDDEVIIQPVMRWAANNNIAVTASLHGFNLSVQLTDLHVRAVARITVKPLVPVFPCFSRITLALMDKASQGGGLMHRWAGGF
ncbi:unnamed protein product, partial [Closterium sp. NIES-53]